MSKLILCEGKTDAIFISYYLELMHGWTHKFEKSRQQKSFVAKVNSIKGESMEWYKKDDDCLLICAVGGKDNFREFIRSKILPAMIDSSLFKRIAIMTDSDDRDDDSICQSVQSCFNTITICMKNNDWVDNSYINSFGQEINFNFLLLIIPQGKAGALETVFIDTIAEDEYDKEIVCKAKQYINEIEPFASRYISKNRLKAKACLGVIWATQFPENIFSLRDEQIRSVNWIKSETISECFCELVKI